MGGIQANNSYPADFLLENLKIQLNVIETAWRSGVRRLFTGLKLCEAVAHQLVWAGRQLPPRQQPCAAGADPPLL
jgi:nucleoside-diphosphate-sugar epimerase